MTHIEFLTALKNKFIKASNTVPGTSFPQYVIAIFLIQSGQFCLFPWVSFCSSQNIAEQCAKSSMAVRRGPSPWQLPEASFLSTFGQKQATKKMLPELRPVCLLTGTSFPSLGVSSSHPISCLVGLSVLVCCLVTNPCHHFPPPWPLAPDPAPTEPQKTHSFGWGGAVRGFSLGCILF